MSPQAEAGPTGQADSSRSADGEAIPPTPSPSSKMDPLPEGLQIEQNDLVIFAEDGQFYLVSEKAYKASPLPESLWATPEFVVGLGAVAADLQSFAGGSEKADSLYALTNGIPCIVLNLASLMNDREKAGAARIDPKPRLFPRGPDEFLPSAAAQVPVTSRVPEVDKRDVVIFDNQGSFYWVKHEEHLDPKRCRPLPDALTSAPMLAASLGTVLADIPFLPTVGASCVLLNLAFLRCGGEKAASLLSETMKKADERDEEAEKAVQKKLEDRNKAAATGPQGSRSE